MLDPPTVDITGRIMEMLATYGYDKNHKAVKKAIEFLRRQEPDGSWFGRWWCELHLRHHAGPSWSGSDRRGSSRALYTAGRGVLRMVQNSDGGWGESCHSYDDPNAKGLGESTASQTAWAVMGLMAANDTRSDSTARGIAYLLRTQKKDGSWDEPYCTGTGSHACFI